MRVTVVGGGLAGCEAAWQLASRGIDVRLVEMKPAKYSPAHVSENLGELVCSNSLRSNSMESAVGILKEEMRLLNSLIIEAALETRVPAGRALAVDRERFSAFITERLQTHPLIDIEHREVCSLPPETDGTVIIATGPLTSENLAKAITEQLGGHGLAFYDAIAPIVYADSLDHSKLFRASRYDADEGDYLNAPMDETLYRKFVAAILEAQKVALHPFEDPTYFEGCLPIEELARRGPDTLAYGPMKPVGLIDPATGKQPFAVVQLRMENREGTLYNMVGFQTKMTQPEQQRVFRMIPGLENAEFARFGSIHRNTYINAPLYLDGFCRSRTAPHIFFAGQITGVEGYVESAASGLAVGLMAGLLSRGSVPPLPPTTTAMGGLLSHTRSTPRNRYEPMNVNFGLMDPPPKHVRKREKKQFLAQRALSDIHDWKAAIDGLYARSQN
ncbi:MAG: methylenetetrahydrofolate--tRNA-(uracil(54)-C(5))-methyltransferase (FADH(2)-oxidizing) TrmFO [Desulfomonilaceae bacterium]